MSARRKRAGKSQPASPKKNPPKPQSPAASPRRLASALTCAREALEECVGAICLVEVAMHSLESQEIASPEQEVLMRGLKAIWLVHDWIYELTPAGISCERTDREDES